MAPTSTPKVNAHKRQNLTILTNNSGALSPEEQMRHIERLGKLVGRNLYFMHLKLQQDVKRKQEEAGRAGSEDCIWKPRMNIYDDPMNEKIVATFEVPGVPQSAIRVTVRNGILTFEGKRQMDIQPLGPDAQWTFTKKQDAREYDATTKLSPDAKYSDMEVDNDQDSLSGGEADSGDQADPFPRVVCSELRFGLFKRELKLPPGVERAHVDVTLLNGMVKITWPRHPPARVINSSSVRDEPHSLERSPHNQNN
ncbi:hypothetical protein V5O48_007879 [Marasmius crinis-equi]|uniref:SHSP domain-containing protein n=1 Tax=Marasmius crinis-equi TaxID=585013 RepID=A0ABR3FFL1_9AGAR